MKPGSFKVKNRWRHPRAALRIAIVMALAGCSGPHDDSPFREGRVLDYQPPRATIHVVRPTDRQVFRPREKAEIVIEVELPEGGFAPSLGAYWLEGKKHKFFGHPRLESSAGRIGRYRCRMRPPEKPGLHRIEIESTHTMLVDGEFKHVQLWDRGPTIEVR